MLRCMLHQTTLLDRVHINTEEEANKTLIKTRAEHRMDPYLNLFYFLCIFHCHIVYQPLIIFFYPQDLHKSSDKDNLN